MKKKKIENILITGGAGYIGSHVAKQLEKHYKIYIIDNLSNGYKKLIIKNSKFLKGDIRNFNLVCNFLKKNNIDTVIHCAGLLNVEESMKKKNLYIENNINGTKLLLEAMKKNKIKNLIFSSTCSVYGKVKSSVSEKNKTKPISNYGKTKLKCENLIKQFYNKGYIKNCAILRFFNVAGSNYKSNLGQIKDNGQLIKNLCLTKKKKQKNFFIYGNNYITKDGTCVRDYIHVMDLAGIHSEILKKFNKISFFKILNCGYGKGSSVKEIVSNFQKISKYKLNIVYKPRRAGDPPEVVSNIKLLNSFLKFKPKFNSLKKIIYSSYKWEERKSK